MTFLLLLIAIVVLHSTVILASSSRSSSSPSGSPPIAQRVESILGAHMHDEASHNVIRVHHEGLVHRLQSLAHEQHSEAILDGENKAVRKLDQRHYATKHIPRITTEGEYEKHLQELTPLPTYADYYTKRRHDINKHREDAKKELERGMALEFMSQHMYPGFTKKEKTTRDE